MCEPTTILLAVAVASAVASTAAQAQSAKAQAAAQKANFKRTKDNADQAFLADAAAENQRLIEGATADSQRIQDVQRQSLQAQATARVASGEAGVAGLSVDALLGDFRRDEATFVDRTLVSQGFRETQSQRRLDGSLATRQGRVNAARPQPIEQPDFLGAALRIGAAGAQFQQSQAAAA